MGGDNRCILDWSRSVRKKRKLEAAASENEQTLITEYIKILDDVQYLIKHNEQLSQLLNTQLSKPAIEPAVSGGSILGKITAAIKFNADKCPTQRRHDDTIKKFSTALYILCGSIGYEFLHKSIPQALPSLRTVQTAQVFSYTRGRVSIR